MKATSRHKVTVEAEIPDNVVAILDQDPFTPETRSRRLLVIVAESDESVEAAEQDILTTVERIIQAVKA